MLITRAGAEGVDTINSQNLIILDHQFNDALSNQIIACAVRFKSHHGLATKERYVNVTRLFLSLETETPVIKAIIDKTIDYTAFYREMKESTQLQIKITAKDKGQYMPNKKELKIFKRPSENYIYPN